MKVGGKHYRSLWADESQGLVHFIDQARLPHVFETATARTPEEMAALIDQLERCDMRRTCPHGRPTMIHLSHAQLEREFGRR